MHISPNEFSVHFRVHVIELESKNWWAQSIVSLALSSGAAEPMAFTLETKLIHGARAHRNENIIPFRVVAGNKEAFLDYFVSFLNSSVRSMRSMHSRGARE